MIKVDERFSLFRDKYCWHLHERRSGIREDGGVSERPYVTYFGNLGQAFADILDRRLGGADSLSAVAAIVKETREQLLAVREVPSDSS